MIRQSKKIAVLVTGMHRSGTSALARVLNIVGCDLPTTLLDANPTNERGHWESRKVVLLNDEILASAGSSWRDWRFFNRQWYASPIADGFRRRAQETLEGEFGDSPLFVLKDPRICRLLPFWIEVVKAHGAEPFVVSPIRNPLDVAASLETRDGIDPSVGHLLWLRHVLDAENDTRGMKRVWMRYDALLSEPHAVVDAIGDALGVSWPKSTSVGAQIDLDEFITPNLRHHWSSDTRLLGDPKLSHWIKTSFDILNRWVHGDANGKDVEELDQIRSAFDAALPAFSRAFASSDRAVAERDERIEGLDRAVAERDGRIEGLDRAVAERDGRIEGLDRAVAERDGRIEGLDRAVAERDGRIEGLDRAVAERDGRIEGLDRAVAERDGRIEGLDRAVAERDGRIEGLDRAVAERDGRIEGLDRAVAERDGRIEGLDRAVAERDGRIEGLDRAVVDRDRQIGELYGSTSWRITAPLRCLKRSARLVLTRTRAGLSQVGRTIYRRTPLPLSVKIGIKNTIFKLAPVPFKHTLAYQNWKKIEYNIVSVEKKQKHISWGILTTPHTLFIAKLIERRLREHGWNVHLMTELSDEFSCDFYVAICPQIFKRLPPYERLISFQMEQSVSSRWFNERYLDILRNSHAVLEYAIHNLPFLKDKGLSFPHVTYLPIGGEHLYDDGSPPYVKTCDVLFYGDNLSSPRRQRMLSVLKRKFRIRVENNTFGSAIEELIRSARVVVNIHYYHDALLEVPRIWECLSLGTPVVSESTKDQSDYPELEGVVKFFEQDSIPSMLLAVEKALENPISELAIRKAVDISGRRFAFMFDRFLMSMNFLPCSYADEIDLLIPKHADKIILSMPETYERRYAVLSEPRLERWTLFDGIRRQPSWIGCGLSYRVLARHAMYHDMDRLVVAEDDVSLPEGFSERFEIVSRFLDQRTDQWTMFCGLISDLHKDTKVLSVDDVEGMTFVTIDKMTSTVFNIYSRRSLQMLASWNPEISDPHLNTIDRFIENHKQLRIVVTIPFLVRQNDNLDSILWGFENTTYSKMIMESESKLRKLVETSTPR